MKINCIKTYDYKFNHHTSLNNIAFKKAHNQDTFVSKPPLLKTGKYYNDMIAQTKAKLNEAIDKYGCFETALNLKKMQITNSNKLENVPSVEFQKAKSLEEAKQYAFDTFHIKYFNVNDLSTANFINEALTRVLNLSQGNVFMPIAISIKPMNEADVKGEYKIFENEICLSSELFNNNKIIDNPEDLEKLSYWQREKYDTDIYELRRILFHELGHCNNYSNKAQKALQKAMEVYPPKLIELNDLINQYFTQIEQFRKAKEKLATKKNPIVEKLGDFIYSKQSQKQQATENIKKSDCLKDIDIEEEPLPWGEKEKSIALLVSSYAIKDREEFLAETFMKMCFADRFFITQQVKDLYLESGGILFPGNAINL